MLEQTGRELEGDWTTREATRTGGARPVMVWWWARLVKLSAWWVQAFLPVHTNSSSGY